MRKSLSRRSLETLTIVPFMGLLSACQPTPPSLPANAALSANSQIPSVSGLRERLAPASRDALTRSPLPVLLFANPALVAETTATSGPAWYALSVRDGERTIALHVVHETPSRDGSPPLGHDLRVRRAPAMVLYNEGVRSVTWSESSATYALEIECARPFEDTACTDRAYVMALAESLQRVEFNTVNSQTNSALQQGGVR
ncbi:MAG: hypothetical protein Q8Q09_28295 [Deltaproteobacteria bacterium]|nr:hypothetical protein [Deltaproteobacteria bacterium]